MEKCVILTPVAQSIAPACEAGLRQLEAKGYPVWRVYGFAAIDVARSWIATQALQQGFEELMWIDADVGFELAAVERLRSHNLDVVAGVYPKKGKHALACHVLPGTDRLILGQKGGLTEVLYTGAGFLYTRCRLYEDIRQVCQLPVCNEHFGDPLIPFFQPLVTEEEGSHRYLGEDFAFCHRARQAGRLYAPGMEITGGARIPPGSFLSPCRRRSTRASPARGTSVPCSLRRQPPCRPRSGCCRSIARPVPACYTGRAVRPRCSRGPCADPRTVAARQRTT